MKFQIRKLIYWLPRIVAILNIIFWFIFVIFSHGISLISIIESIVWLTPLVALIIAWKHEKIGGLIFISLGILSALLMYNKLSIDEILALLIFISSPLIITGILFLISYQDNLPKKHLKKLKSKRTKRKK